MELSKKNIKKILLVITFAVILFSASQHLSVVVNAVNWILKVLSPVIIGLCIAFVLNVFMAAVENRIFGFMGRSKRNAIRKMQRPLSLIITLLLALGLVALFLFIVIPELHDTVVLLVSKLPSYAESAALWIEKMIKRFTLDIDTAFLHTRNINWGKIAAAAQKFLAFDNAGDILNTTVTITSSVVIGITNFFLGFVIAIYVLAQKEKIGRFFHKVTEALLPAKGYKKITEICTVAFSSFSSFVTGQFADAAVLSTLCFLGMTIFRFPNAASVAFIIGITALMPVIGPIIGEAIGFMIIFMKSPLDAVLFIVFMFILQAIDNNIIYPRIVGKSVGLPGIIVLVAVIIGGNVCGLLGVLLGVPTASALYALTLDWLNKTHDAKVQKVLENTEISDGAEKITENQQE